MRAGVSAAQINPRALKACLSCSEVYLLRKFGVEVGKGRGIGTGGVDEDGCLGIMVAVL